MGVLHTKGPPNLEQNTRHYCNQQKKRELAKLSTLLYQPTTEYN